MLGKTKFLGNKEVFPFRKVNFAHFGKDLDNSCENESGKKIKLLENATNKLIVVSSRSICPLRGQILPLFIENTRKWW